MSNEFPGLTLTVIDIAEIRNRTLASNLPVINWLLQMANEVSLNGDYARRNAYLKPIREISNSITSLVNLSIAEIRQIDGVGKSISEGIYKLLHS